MDYEITEHIPDTSLSPKERMLIQAKERYTGNPLVHGNVNVDSSDIKLSETGKGRDRKVTIVAGTCGFRDTVTLYDGKWIRIINPKYNQK